MNYFINIKEYSDTPAGTFLTYRLYSGSSIEGIKEMVLDGLKDTWIDNSEDIDNLENSPSLSFDDIADTFNNALYEDYDYSIEISEPYIDIKNTIDFYSDYEDSQKELDDLEVGFYAYGKYAMILDKSGFRIYIEGISTSRILNKMYKDGVFQND
jgi:hypothetical protein